MTITKQEIEKHVDEPRFYPIEPSTGLPFLPEGHWWEVLQTEFDGYSEKKYQLHIKTTVTIGVRVRAGTATFWQKFWGRTPEPIVEPAYEEEVSVSYQTFYDDHGKARKFITPEHISKFSQVVAARFYERKQEEALAKQSKTLLGKYPPLSIADH